VDFPTFFSRFSSLGVPTKFIVDSFIGFNILLVHDGGIKRLELDLFHHMVVNWSGNLLWLQPKK
jgi:hypothetical protein